MMRPQNEKIEDYSKALIAYFYALNPMVQANELNELVEQFTIDKFSKKDMILKAGDFSECVYFIHKGLVRIYYVKEGKEITNWFIKENMVFAATYSLITGGANYNNYEALEDTYVLKIKYSTLEAFYAKYHSLEHLGRKLVESYYGAFMKKTFDVLFLSAEERYSLFVRDNSDLLNRVPLKYIASFLGITQETLSRMRAKY